MKLRRIMFVNLNMHRSGAQRVMSIICNEFVKMNIEICLCYTDKNREPSYYPLDPRIEVFYSRSPILERLSNAESKLNPGGGVDYHLKLLRLRIKVKQYKPQVIVAFMDYPAKFTLVATRGLKIPVVLATRNSLYDRIERDSRFVSDYEMYYKKYAGIVFQTLEQQESYNSVFYPLNNIKQIIIMNPIENSPLWDIPREKIPYELVAVGREHEQKNYPLLLNAFAEALKRLPQLKLSIYGRINSNSELYHLSEELGIKDKVTFHGSVTDIDEMLAKASAFVMASVYEGIPNALVEALCMGVPCITTNFGGGGAHILIDNEVNGLIVPSNDEKGLSEAICRIFKETEFSEKIGNNAKKLRSLIDSKIIAEQWYSFLNDLISV